ncbi:MAG: transcriptional regulator, AraC family [Myxococcaceae bacterium]|nr:transcriptional regulator, AraC family [Myxococcaceae bacterium]
MHPVDGLSHFVLAREPAPADLAPFVEGFWSVRWELEQQPAFEQEILPYPCVNLAFEEGALRVHGPGTRRFVAKLSGSGRVTGAKFTPAGFFAFASVSMRSLLDCVLPLEEATGRPCPLPADDQPKTVQATVEAFLRACDPQRHAASALVDQLIAAVQHDRGIARADQLARLAGMSLRSLHRLFERHVGVSPKWVVRRSRVQEAAERVARGERVDWASTAQELGYHDQAHLIRDFHAQVGFTPAAYARRQRQERCL